MSNYRMDNRSKEQFIQDIEKGNERERFAIILFKNYLRREFGFTGRIEPNGVDMSGDFIEDDRKVTTEADYLVNGKPMEVKTSRNEVKFLYLKTSQVNSYIKQKASLLFVNDVEGDRPFFTFFTVEDLQEIQRNAQVVFPKNNINGGKKSYFIDGTELEWRFFGGGRKYIES